MGALRDQVLGQTSGVAAVSVVAAVALLWLLFSSFRSWYSLRHVPGPRGAALSKWWMLRNTLSGKMHLALKQVCEEYGM